MNISYFCIICIYCMIDFCYGAIYTHTWAVHIEGGERVARDLAVKHGFTYLGTILDDIYHLHHRHVSKRSVHQNVFHHKKLQNEPQVKWLQQQIVKKRKKRYAAPEDNYNDPKWGKMWYLNPKSNSKNHGITMNVIPAWEKGYTGKNVVVTILDDGIEKNHPDLQENYEAQASYDVNNNDNDPQPRYDFANENRHGTRCAGEVAAKANNNICSVGVAYNARIGGIRMLDGDVTDAVEARSLGYNPQVIDIYSASWGPDDDGTTVDGPAIMAEKAFYDGITKGRGGKGSIFVWASGNGGRDDDSCNCDGYTNSIYTLSISSTTENGHIPWYSEACSSTLATTYSSGNSQEKQIVTTDLRLSCTETHTGTSASAPLAAGICALALESNPNLTWRDMQHIVVHTAKPYNLHASDWVTNGVGRKVSHSFGYGLMDASAMVDLAKNWTTVPPQHQCEVAGRDKNKVISSKQTLTVRITTDGCKGYPSNHVRYLEHVQAKISLKSLKRGDIQIYLTSPQGTKSTLLARRSKDVSKDGFADWAFMTTHNWGEFSEGTWTLEIHNGAMLSASSRLAEWTLILYGTATDPQPPRPPPPKPTKPTTKPVPPPRPGKTTSTTKEHTPNVKHETQAITMSSKATTTTAMTYPSHIQHSTYRSTPNEVIVKSTTAAAELRSWTLTMSGTSQHPQSGNKSTMSSGCEEGQFTYGDSCVDVCPVGSYVSTVDNTSVCQPCDPLCKQCDGPKPNMCLACHTFYSLGNGTCTKKLQFNFVNPQVIWYYTLAVLFCITSVFLFLLIFFLLQAHANGYLCWKEKRNRKVDMGKVQYNGIQSGSDKSLLDLDSDSDEAEYVRGQRI